MYLTPPSLPRPAVFFLMTPMVLDTGELLPDNVKMVRSGVQPKDGSRSDD